MIVNNKYMMFFKVKITSETICSQGDFHTVMIFQVLLFCLITYGHGRPSNSDEHEEIMREAKKEKYFQQ